MYRHPQADVGIDGSLISEMAKRTWIEKRIKQGINLPDNVKRRSSPSRDRLYDGNLRNSRRSIGTSFNSLKKCCRISRLFPFSIIGTSQEGRLDKGKKNGSIKES